MPSKEICQKCKHSEFIDGVDEWVCNIFDVDIMYRLSNNSTIVEDCIYIPEQIVDTQKTKIVPFEKANLIYTSEWHTIKSYRDSKAVNTIIAILFVICFTLSLLYILIKELS